MSIDVRCRVAGDGVRATTHGVDPERRLAELRRESGLRRWVAAIAAGSLVVAIVAVGWLAQVQRDAASTPEIPAGPVRAVELQVVQEFLSAYQRYDAEAALRLVGPTALADLEGSAEEFRLLLAWEEASGYRENVERCEPLRTVAADPRFQCAVSYSGIRSDQLGLSPYAGSYWLFTVRGSTIVSARRTLVFTGNGFSAQVWEPFATWVSDRRPEDAAVMYVDTSHTMERHTPRSNVLWRENSRAYVAEYWAASTESAEDSYDGTVDRARAICGAAHARLVTVAGPEPYSPAWADVLDETVAELRSVPAPRESRRLFEKAYDEVARLASAMRAGSVEDLVDLLHHVEQSRLGVEECSFHGPR